MSNEYKDIAKTNLIFGGVKLLQVIVNILKTKIVAVFLGPIGVGIQIMLINAITTFYQFANLGIAQSTVRELSVSQEDNKKRKIVKAVRFITVLLGIISSIIFFICAPLFSEMLFGKDTFAWMLRIVSVSLFFESISNTEIAILQGLRRIKALSIASLISSILVLIISIPLYYYWKDKAIPYVLAFGYALTTIIYVIFRNKYKYSNKMPYKELIDTSKPIFSLGFALMASNGVMSIFALLTSTFIYRIGSSEDLGLFSAASTCTYSAINILVAILAADYFPRLSSVISNLDEAKELVNKQIDLLLAILTPIVGFIIIFPSLFLNLLYSSKFDSASDAVQLMALSLFFRIIWHCFSYIILAKGDKKIYFFVDACFGNGIFMLLNLFGFWLFGLSGIAVSFIVASIIVCIILYIVISNKYNFNISRFQ